MPDLDAHAADERQLDRLEHKLDLILELLERGRGARDAADMLLLAAILESTIGSRFTAGECFRHAQVEPDLDTALKGADVDNGIQLGLLLKRMTGATIGDAQLECTDELDREGRVYRFRGLQE